LNRETETELARGVITGADGAFDRFVEHFRTKIFHYSWMMCGQREDAEEVAQETLLKVFENFHTLQAPERVKPWVFRIAKNACLMKRRKSVFAPAVSQEVSLDELRPAKAGEAGDVRIEIADWSQIPEDQALASEIRRTLTTAIAALPEHYRSVILLRDVEEMSTQDTSQILDLTEDAVKQRLHRARLMVRKTLDERLNGVAHGRK
jgi:RNA polymerase sigma-70 factor, ECF subfamily